MHTVTKSALMGATMLGLAGAASAQGFEIQGGDALNPEASIVENMQLVQNFSTLIAAVQAAGIEDVLQGPGPFTVFAPLDSAFEALDPGTVDELLEPANIDRLVEILQTHVVSGVYTADDLSLAFVTSDEAVGGTDTATLAIEGEDIRLNTLSPWDLLLSRSGESFIVSTDPVATDRTTQVVVPDILASNGVIHVIDGVLIPN
jgi:uncharacterized surface protein with fasciclin (FAS1) repeats